VLWHQCLKTDPPFPPVHMCTPSDLQLCALDAAPLKTNIAGGETAHGGSLVNLQPALQRCRPCTAGDLTYLVFLVCCCQSVDIKMPVIVYRGRCASALLYYSGYVRHTVIVRVPVHSPMHEELSRFCTTHNVLEDVCNEGH
jgi:hypothetical protein